jgi:single-strand DNA-binding protein
MININKVTLIGNLGADPLLEWTQNGLARCRLRVATSKIYTKDNKQYKQTEWHNVTTWGKTAENAGKFLSKGCLVYIEASLQSRSWNNEKTGQKQYSVDINAHQVSLLNKLNNIYNENTLDIEGSDELL